MRCPTPPQLADDALLIRIDRFALTANNITYAVLGDQLKYWQLFPAPEGFGNIPVWGFGDVIASRHPAVSDGERLFGYFPMATHLVIEAGNVSKRGLRDASAHRQSVAPVYNAYARVSGDAAFAGRAGDYQALLRPLFMLSFLVDDFLSENEFYGARRVMLSSASSKTAFGLAHLLHRRREAGRGGRPDFGGQCRISSGSLGCYDDVVSYDDLSSLPSNSPTALVDMAGNSELRAWLHRHFGDQMKYSGRIGLTHRSSSPDEPALPGAQPTWFFAPDQIRKRAKEWGPGGVDRRFSAAWADFAPMLERWLNGDRKPRAGGGDANLSRYVEWPRSAGSGTHLVAGGLNGHRTLSARPQTGIGLRQGSAATRRQREARMLDRTDDISLAVDSWLAQFEKALAEPDGILLKPLFHAESYWRDVVALSWSLQTVNGADAILNALKAHAGAASPRDFKIDPDRAAPRHVTRAGTGTVEAIFGFETAQGRGSGILRLAPDAGDGCTLKAWTLLTALEETWV